MAFVWAALKVWPWLSTQLSEERRAANQRAADTAKRRAEVEQTLVEVLIDRLDKHEAILESLRSELREEFRATIQPGLTIMGQLTTELRDRLPRTARTRETDRTADAAANGAARE